MEVTFDIINGLSFGLEYVAGIEGTDIPNPCIVVDFACFRWILELVR